MADTSPSSVTPLEGKTTVDDKMFFEPERLSYQSADGIAVRIASKVTETIKGHLVVIAGTQLLSDFANLQGVYITLDSLAKDYKSVTDLGIGVAERRSLPPLEDVLALAHESLIADTISAALAPASALVSATLGLVSFFREDVEYHGEKTTVDTLAFEIALASRLKVKVIVPDLMVISKPQLDEDSLTVLLAKTQKAKARAWAAVGPMISELVSLEGKLDQAAREKDQARFDRLSAQVSDLRRDMQPVSDPLSRSDQRLADLQNQWNKVDESSGLSQLARLLRAEVIRAKDPLYLHAKVISSGGHHRVSRSLFRTLFLGDGLSFAGGAVVRWALLANDGSVTQGGILTERQDSSTLRLLPSRDPINEIDKENEPTLIGEGTTKEQQLVKEESAS